MSSTIQERGPKQRKQGVPETNTHVPPPQQQQQPQPHLVAGANAVPITNHNGSAPPPGQFMLPTVQMHQNLIPHDFNGRNFPTAAFPSPQLFAGNSTLTTEGQNQYRLNIHELPTSLPSYQAAGSVGQYPYAHVQQASHQQPQQGYGMQAPPAGGGMSNGSMPQVAGGPALNYRMQPQQQQQFARPAVQSYVPQPYYPYMYQDPSAGAPIFAQPTVHTQYATQQVMDPNVWQQQQGYGYAQVPVQMIQHQSLSHGGVPGGMHQGGGAGGMQHGGHAGAQIMTSQPPPSGMVGMPQGQGNMQGGGQQQMGGQPAAAPQRTKKVLAIVNPETNEKINQEAVEAAEHGGSVAKSSDKSSAAAASAPSSNATTDQKEQEKVARVRQELMSQMTNVVNNGNIDGRRSRVTSTTASAVGEDMVDHAKAAPPTQQQPRTRTQSKCLIDPDSIGITPFKKEQRTTAQQQPAEVKAAAEEEEAAGAAVEKTTTAATPADSKEDASQKEDKPAEMTVATEAASQPARSGQEEEVEEVAATPAPTTTSTAREDEETHDEEAAAINASSSSSEKNTSGDSAVCLQVSPSSASAHHEEVEQEKRDAKPNKKQQKQSVTPRASDAAEKKEEKATPPPVTVSPPAEEEPEGEETAEEAGATPATSSTATATVQEEDEDSERAEEERKAEERRKREEELYAQRERLEENPEEVDSAKCIYGRDFLYTVRDIEKEFNPTDCPLTPKQLLDFGICRSLISSEQRRGGGGGGGGHQNRGFMPDWIRNQGGPGGGGPPGGPPGGQRPKYGGRMSEQHNRPPRGGGGGQGGGQRKMPPAFRPSIERNAVDRSVQLHKSVHAWKPDKVSKDDESEQAKNKLLLKSVRALFNKITPTTQDELVQEFLGFNVPNSVVLNEVIGIIFDKAVEEPKFCPLYSQLCLTQVNAELQVTSGQSLFRNSILTRAQETFNAKTHDDFVTEKRKEIDAEPDSKKKKEKEIELLEGMARFRRRKFGNITFIGQLFLRSLLSTKIVQFCIQDLLKATTLQSPNNDEESIACAVQLLETTGPKLESDLKGSAPFDSIFNHLDQLQNAVSKRIKFMIMNLMELRRARWQAKKGDAGPKKLDEIKKDIKNEQMINLQQREQYDRKTSRGSMHGGPMGGGAGGGGQMGGSNRPRIIGRGSLDNRTGTSYGSASGTSQDRRRQAANSAALVSSSTQPKNFSLKTLDNKMELSRPKNAWSSGAGAVRGSGRDERADALNNVKSMMSVVRSNSQASIASDGAESRKPPSATDTGNNSEEEEQKAPGIDELIKPIAQTINSDISEFMSGDLKIEEVRAGIFEIPTKDKFKDAPLDTIMRAFVQGAVTLVKGQEAPEKRKRYGWALALTMSEADPGQKAAMCKGIADYCRAIVEMEEWEEMPKLWEFVAEVLINAVMCDEGVYSGARPQLSDFKDAFIEAAADTRKPYELLVVVLRRLAEINYSRDKHQHDTMSSMAFAELDFIKELDGKKLDDALKKEKGMGDAENLWQLFQH